MFPFTAHRQTSTLGLLAVLTGVLPTAGVSEAGTVYFNINGAVDSTNWFKRRWVDIMRTLFFAIALIAQPVFAGPFTATLTGVATGTLGSQSFTDATSIMTFTGDTDNYQTSQFPTTGVVVTLRNIMGNLGGNIDGIGAFSFSSPFVIVAVDLTSLDDPPPFSSIVALVADGSASLVYSTNEVFDLLTSTSFPLDVYGAYPDVANPFETNLGHFTLSNFTPVTFDSTVNTSSNAVPEPNIWTLMALGLVGLSATKKRVTI